MESGGEMEHFTTQKWIDFVNQVVTANENQLMEKHLKQGCKRCEKTVSLWQRVRQSAVAQERDQPPEGIVRLAKAAFAGAGVTARRKGKESRIKILFDSFLQPVFSGARSAGPCEREKLHILQHP